MTTKAIPNYRIGNDLPISLIVDDTATPMTAGNTTVTLYEPYGYPVSIAWSIVGNRVSGTFLGKDQKRTGLYTVKVVINNGLPGMVTRDMQLFRLVAHSWEADAEPAGGEDVSDDSVAGDSSSDSSE